MDGTLELVAVDGAGATVVVKRFSVFARPPMALDGRLNPATALTGLDAQYTVGMLVKGGCPRNNLVRHLDSHLSRNAPEHCRFLFRPKLPGE